ncbi:MAG: radical SAM family heme chaperone HemW [Chloroflexi bacterium]|nr:radical SAM family heme chaperone HemW [Chloroflexota bacterium]
MSHPIALYLHIPFCETKCPYCDFNTYAGIEPLIPQYVDALAEELRLWGQALADSPKVKVILPPQKSSEGRRVPQQVGTIFFGGGTPSYLPPQHIQRLMDTARASFHLLPDAEATLESNPGDVTPERLAAWRQAGINRLSIGVQSLDDGLLSLLGRRHTSAEAVQAYRNARAAGFTNVNLDLMFGLPRQTLAQWRDTLAPILDLRPEHLSMYCLTLEEGTPLWAWVRSGAVPEPDPDLAADMYLLAQELAEAAGYDHYEISNWALPGYEARHNLAYWRSQPYLGVGPGAHSYLDGYRFAVAKSPRTYIQQVRECSSLPASLWTPQALKERGLLESSEAIDARTARGETMMMGLRLSEGVADAAFRGRFGVGLRETYASQILDLEEVGLLCWEGDCLKLTARGKLLGNEVFQRFLG